MAQYKIVGTARVAGKAPGETVELDLPEPNIAALVRAGHIEPALKPKPSKKSMVGEKGPEKVSLPPDAEIKPPDDNSGSDRDYNPPEAS